MTAALGIVPALGSAALFGGASALQHVEVRAVADRVALDGRLLVDLARRGRWWLGIVADAGAVGLQVLALHLAPVALVQACLVLGLPVAVLLTARGRLRAVAVAGTALTTAGVLAFGAVQPLETPHRPGTSAVLLPLGALVLAAVAVLRSRTRPVVVALAAGLAAGAAAALLAVAAAAPWHALLTQPATWAAVVAGLVALQLSQSALAAEDPGSALAALTLAEPVTAVVLAAAVLHQRPDLGAVALVGAITAAAGVLLLERRPPPSV